MFGSLCLMSLHRPLPRPTIAILRPVRFCWYRMFRSVVRSTSKPAASAASSSSPFRRASHPRDRASSTAWSGRAPATPRGVPLSKRTRIHRPDTGSTAEHWDQSSAAMDRHPSGPSLREIGQALTPGHATPRRPSSRRSQPAVWFQLANGRVAGVSFLAIEGGRHPGWRRPRCTLRCLRTRGELIRKVLAGCQRLELGRMLEALDLAQPARQWVPTRENPATISLAQHRQELAGGRSRDRG